MASAPGMATLGRYRRIARLMTLRAARIESYVLRQLGFGLVAVTGGLVALIWLTQSLRFVELVVNRGLSFRVFLQLTSLLLQNFVAIILPLPASWWCCSSIRNSQPIAN